MSAVIERQIYQVKLGNRWEDMALDISNLANLAANVMSAKGPDLQKIHNLVTNYHGTTKAIDKAIHSIVGIYYTLQSVNEDVLKISYEYTVRYGDDKERAKAERARLKHAAKEAKTKSSWPAPNVVSEDKQITGEITLMPGN